MLLLATSAPVMWWKRRQAGKLRAPPAPEDPRRSRGLLVIMGAIGLVFPLTGATMIVALLLGMLLRGASPRGASANA